MKLKVLLILLIASVLMFSAENAMAIISDNISDCNEARNIYSGPRIGLTVITGEYAEDLEEEFGIKPIITQFGWQFETQFLVVENGVTGLTELVLLWGGAEQGVLLPSLSWMIGLRMPSGFEFGFGPNLGLSGVSMVGSIGYTNHTSQVSIPMNLAVTSSEKGVRFSFLIGFNSRQ